MKRKRIFIPLMPVALFAMIWTGCEKDYNYIAPEVVINPNVEVSYSKNIQPIWNSGGCTVSGCHDGANYDPDLTAGNSYAALFNMGDVDTVDAENSIIYQRLILPTSDKKFMPKGGSPLPATEIALILEWIKQGAKDN